VGDVVTGRAGSTTTTKRAPTATAPRASSRDALLGAALRVLTTNPGATIDDVVAASGVSRATMFRQFPTRTALLREVGVVAYAALSDALASSIVDDGDATAGLRRLLGVLVAHGEQLRFLVSAVELYDDPVLDAASLDVDRFIVPVVDAARAAGVLRADVNKDWLWAAADALIFAAWTEVSRGTIARNDATAFVESALLHGFGPSPGTTPKNDHTR
jgi:AcrR family transcriptional regulator